MPKDFDHTLYLNRTLNTGALSVGSIDSLDEALSTQQANFERAQKRIATQQELVEFLKSETNKLAAPSPTGAFDEHRLKFLEQKYRIISAKAVNAKNCDLTPAELAAVFDYAEGGYQKLNSALRADGKTAEEYQPYVEVLRSALAKLKPYVGYVNRGANLPAAALEKHQVGEIVENKFFTSTSIANGFEARQRFVIKSKSGAYIAPLLDQ